MSSLIQEATIKIRQDTASDWSSENPTPLRGEWCYETDTGLVKIGDGSTNWNNLDYLQEFTDDVTITDGDLIIGTAGKGIDFSADGGDLLDDYEEGSWEPDLQFGEAKVGITYAVQAAYYTKIGRSVSFILKTQLSSKGSSTGGARIYGLPFVVNDSQGSTSPNANRLVNISFADVPQSFVFRGNSFIILREINKGGSQSDLDNTNFVDDSIIYMSGTYFTN